MRKLHLMLMLALLMLSITGVAHACEWNDDPSGWCPEWFGDFFDGIKFMLRLR